MERYICIHGHFYQPPRENPWLEEIEFQDSAYPYHDWNERITAECYAPNTASRILDLDGRIVDIANNYSKISFNFGPTVLSWMEKHDPEVYMAVLEADKLSMKRFSGHGSAIAQVYNHMIMPLANRRDKFTQVIWGIKDFEHRFKRPPEGLWLPETAVDIETLEVLAELGIVYTILAPGQAKRVRRMTKGAKWRDVSESRIDPAMPYICNLPSGRKINLFIYDGPISQDIAFSGLLSNGEEFAHRLMRAFSDKRSWPQIVHIATDGETYGHHHRGGDMALTYCLHSIESGDYAKITNYGEYLQKHPPTHMVEIFENSSWSCIHGIERWREHCGCNSGMHPGWSQEWRGPLRNALDLLRDTLAPLYEEEASRYLSVPWEARDRYISVLLDRTSENVESFFRANSVKELHKEEKVKVLKLLELQRNTMLMYTSCGWFFDEISGIETTQVMQYASRVIQLAEDVLGKNIEPDFLGILEKAPSNLHENGSKAYEAFVKPARLDLHRVAAHFGISSIFEEYPEDIKIYCYTANSEKYNVKEAGKQKLVTGRVRIISDITWEEKIVTFAVLHLGDHNINAGIRDFISEEAFSDMQQGIHSSFKKSDIPDIIRFIDDYFGKNTYTIRHLFRDEQRKVSNELMKLTHEEIESSYRQIYEDNYSIMNFFQSIHVPVSKPFSVAAEYVINADLEKALGNSPDPEKLKSIIDEIKKWSLNIDRPKTGYVASNRINSMMETLANKPNDIQFIEEMDVTLKLLGEISVELDLWKAQNIYFSIGRRLYSEMKAKSEEASSKSRVWIDKFRKLGYYLGVKLA
jgi:alpha-amylase/alpha-mannosidase (GH57 family)